MDSRKNFIRKNKAYDVIIVGTGAAGIGCGMVLQDLGVKRFLILDRHEVGASFRRWPAETRLLTPSFTINGFGMLDLNAIALQTSPAYSLHTEHPTGAEYADYLQGVAQYFKLPIREDVTVNEIQLHPDHSGFTLATSRGEMQTHFVIWAGGEFQSPRLDSFAGAELCRHYAAVPSWQMLPGDEFIVIGGYESGVDTAVPLAERAFLQKPTWRGVWWRVRAVLKQFLWQAMPIFLLMCAVGAMLAYTGLLDWLAEVLAPLLGLFGLPGAVAPGVIFAIVRKDGLLILNEGEGALLTSLSVGQLFVLVYLASTLTACLVTLWTVRKELGGRMALTMAGRQATTSLVSTFLLSLVLT